MSPDERISVLESLLAKVRRAAEERGVELPRDLPPGVWRDRLRPKQLTAFAETGGGTHAPLALVEAPLPAPLPPHASEDLSSGVVDVVSSPISAPLVGFGPTFDDEVTSDAGPSALEARALERIEREALERDASRGEPAPPALLESRPEPAVEPAPAERPAAPSAPPTRPSTMPRASSPPIELDDLDDLVLPSPSTPPAAPPAAAPLPPAPDAPPPPAPLAPERTAPTFAKPPPLTEPTPLERAFAAAPLRPAPALPPRPAALAPPPSPATRAQLPPPPPTSTPALQPPPPPPAPAPPAPAPPTPAPPTPAPPTPAPPTPAPPTPTSARAAAPPHISVVPPPEPSEHELAAEPTVDEPVPESQRQKVSLERPIDDALEGVEELPPESGEVESQRVASRARETLDSQPEPLEGARLEPPQIPGAAQPQPIEIDDAEPITPRPAHDVTAEVRSLGDVDVVARPAVPEVQVVTTRGSAARAPLSFGELLDRALELGA